jgi:IS30 family transposase
LNTKIQSETEIKIVALLKKYLSPEQVSLYLKKHHNIEISYESIYRYIYSNKERKNELKPYLRQGKRHYRKRYGSTARSSLIPNRKPISERPKIVDDKKRIGDWECETVIGKDRKSALVTVVERKSLFTVMAIVKRKTAEQVSKAMIGILQPYQDKVKTLTFDNGTEFTHHEKIAKKLSAKTYFCNPYSSWERGINENTNGLIRQFFPKGTNFNDVTNEKIKEVLFLLNNRLRKTRKNKTPNEIFNNQFIPLINC